MGYHEDVIREGKADLGPLFDLLRRPNSLWHRTSPKFLKSIKACGHILPTEDESRFRYPQSSVSVALKLNAVAMFDFESPSEFDMLDMKWVWGAFLVDYGSPTLLLQFDKSDFPKGKIVTQEYLTATKTWPMTPGAITGEEHRAYNIPVVEVWHPGKLPISMCRNILAVHDTRPTNYEFVEFGAFNLD